jgi:hypothetical protein
MVLDPGIELQNSSVRRLSGSKSFIIERLRRSGAGVCFPPAGVFRPCAVPYNQEGKTVNKKFIIAWIVLFVAWFMGSFVVHGLLLRSDYMLLTNLFRPESDEQKYFPLMILAHVILAGAFVWIYARGVEAKPWLAQGVRFGVAVALLTIVPTYMIYFVVQPMPGGVVVKQIICDGVLLVILGIIVAWLYRDSANRGAKASIP